METGIIATEHGGSLKTVIDGETAFPRYIQIQQRSRTGTTLSELSTCGLYDAHLLDTGPIGPG